MKYRIVLLIVIAFSVASYGQNVGIGTSSPNALLDVSAPDNGILIPRVALTGTGSASPLTSPAVSTLVYNTATAGSGATAVAPGFYYWNGSAWVALIDNGSLTGSTTVGNTSSANTLSTTVNGVTGSTVPIINTNALSLSGTTITSTANGVASNALDISSVDKNIYNSDGTLTGSRTVTMGNDILTFASTNGDFNFTTSGFGTVAMGNNVSSIGNNSIAMGASTIANGNYSTAMGQSTTASGDYSTAMGQGSTASGQNSTASGYYALARSSYSTAMGGGTTASGIGSTAMGNGTTASGQYSTAMGQGSTASGDNSTAMGLTTAASGYSSTALGDGTIASGNFSTAMGQSTTASRDNSTAMGNGTTASGTGSTAMGSGTTASGQYSTAMGLNTTASGNYSTAMGLGPTASGQNSTAMGNWTSALSYDEFAVGSFNTSYTPGSATTWVATDRLFGIGNGIPGSTTSDAMVVLKNGNVGIGYSAPTSTLQVNGGISITTLQMTSGGTNGYILKSDASGNGTWVSPSSIGTTNTLVLSTNTLTSTVNGVAATTSAVSGVSNASSVNTLTTTVNGLASSGAPIINSNALGLSGTSLTATINGVASNALDISSIDKNIYNADGTLTGTRTVTMAGNNLSFTGGNVGIGIASPQTNLDVVGAEYIRDNATLGSVASGLKMIAIGGRNYIESAGTGMGTGTTADLKFTSMNASAIWMTIKASGYVGIGQDSPTSMLDVNGNIQISNSTIPMGLMTELQGTTPLLNFDVNFRESNKNTTYRGAGFRIDTRTGEPLFQWITRAAGSGTENVEMTLSETGTLDLTDLIGTGQRPVYADASGNLVVLSTGNKATFSYTGSNTTWNSSYSTPFPSGVTKFTVKLWGAGGGGSSASTGGVGGAGGFITGILTVPSGTTSLTIIVGQGGGAGSSTASFGGGGAGTTVNTHASGSGGGRSAIQIPSVSGDAVTAGGGGGGAALNSPGNGGGGGGGYVGLAGSGGGTQAGGTGGTQSAAGAAGSSTCAVTTAGSGTTGGTGCSASNAGGGGGGWFGGGGGGNGSGNNGGGGGGSSGGNSTYFQLISTQYGAMNNGNTIYGPLPPGGYGDPDYVVGIGISGASLSAPLSGGNGMVIIEW